MMYGGDHRRQLYLDNKSGSSDGSSSMHASGPWTREEDEQLRLAVLRHEGRQWRLISQEIKTRSPVQCRHRWSKTLCPMVSKKPWTAEEDRKLVELVQEYGEKHWSKVASFIPNRIGKQCRERFQNHLDPNLCKGFWSPQEDMLIVKLQAQMGNKWATIARSLPGRSDNAVKNRWNTKLKRHADMLLAQCGEENFELPVSPSDPQSCD